MFKFIKKLFIPHEGNNYRPHFWRRPFVALVALLIVSLFGVSFMAERVLPRIDLIATVYPSILVDLVNQNRNSTGLRTLRQSPILAQAATMKARDMAEKGYFAHTSPDGKKPWYWFTQAGYNFIYAGENLAINFNESADVNTAWMNSPAHRANILNEHFTEVGIAMAVGQYQGRTTTFVVQLFGQPVPADVSVPPVQTVPKATSAIKPAPTIAPKDKMVTVETIIESPTFAAVKNVDTTSYVNKNIPTPIVAGQSNYASWLAKILTSPRRVLGIIYIGLAGFILFALFLLIGIEIGKHHPRHVYYGIALLLLLAVLFYFSRTVILTEVLVL